MKKIQSLPNKNIQSKITSGKPLPTSYSNSRPQSPYSNNSRGIHHVFHQTNTVNQKFRIISTETILPDQTLIEVTTLIIVVHTQTLEKKTTLTIDQETVQTTTREVIQQKLLQQQS